MSKKIPILGLVLWAILLSGVACAADGAAKTKVLLVTGGHGFEKEPFYKVFRDNPRIEFTATEHGKTNATAFDRADLPNFDVVVLYDIRQSMTDAQRARFLSLFDKGIGLVVLHHAIVSYQHWPDYERIIGGKYPEEDGKSGVVTPEVGYKHDEEVPVVIVARDHPITAGMKDFTIHDEIYWGYWVGKEVTPLITTTHPKSAKPLAWVRTEKNSRIVYLQLGHDHQAYENQNYQQLVARSIQWAARR